MEELHRQVQTSELTPGRVFTSDFLIQAQEVKVQV